MPMTKTRQRNPRGQGERLRDDIIEAASRLLADPAAPPLTLRAMDNPVSKASEGDRLEILRETEDSTQTNSRRGMGCRCSSE